MTLTNLNILKSSTLLLADDFNIDLLKTQERPLNKEYLETLFSLNLYPSLTLPTRIAETSATLIDNVFTNCDNKNLHTAGIIITDISDHFPYIYMIKPNKGYLNPPKFVFNRKFSKENLDSLMSELQSINILNLLDNNLNNDPNSNYDILHNILTTTINKHIPLNKVKFNKYRH